MRFLSLPIALLGIIAAGPLAADDWAKTWAVSARPDLKVNADDASVTVQPWERSEIDVKVTTSGWKIADHEVRISERHSSNSVELEVRMPRHNWNFGHRWVKVELRVPAEVQASLHTGDGSITVEGLKGATVLSSGDGTIRATGLDGRLDARTGDGSIHIRGRFDGLEVRTGDGSVEADVIPGSRMATAWHVHTGDGRVTLRLPPDFSAEIEAHTGDGHITADLPVTISGGLNKSELRGRMNGGGQALVVRTNDGAIRLERL